MRRFTEQDEKVILKHVAAKSCDLRKAFKDAGEEIGRSWTSIQNHYYGVMRPEWVLGHYKSWQKPFFDKIRNMSQYRPNVKNEPVVSIPERIASITKRLEKRKAQKRKTAKCITETYLLSKSLRNLKKQLH